MGEYAVRKSDGAEIKIGTCESMYYLRADQAQDVTAERGSVDPVRDAEAIRFRFPFPAEDGVKPGEHDHPVPALLVNYPEGLYAQHGTIVVQGMDEGSKGLRAVLPCPQFAPELWTYGNRHPMQVSIQYQGVRGGAQLAVIVSCAQCGAMWNLPEREQAERLVVALRSQADEIARRGQYRLDETHRVHGADCGDSLGEHEIAQAAELHVVADRILAGYDNPPAWVARFATVTA